MNDLHNILWWVGGCTLVHFLWGGAFIGCLALVIRLLLPHRAFRARYVFALTVFTILVALPPLLGWQILSQIQQRDAAAATTVDAVEVVPDEVMTASPAATALRLTAPVSPAPRKHVFSPAVMAVLTWIAPWLAMTWLVGSGALMASLVAGLVRTASVRRRARFVTKGPVGQICREVSRGFEIGPVPVGFSSRIDSPILVGIVRPAILLPECAARWAPRQLEMVLLHELSHVRRLDNVINLLQRLVESLLFFQPAVWCVSRWIRAAREECCDEAVVRRTGRPLEYAQILVQLAGRQRPAHLAVAMGEHHLVGRVRRILNRSEQRPRSLGRAIALAGAMLLSGQASVMVLRAGLIVPDRVPSRLQLEAQTPALPSPLSTAAASTPRVVLPEPEQKLTPWWLAGGGSQGGTNLHLLDPSGAPVAGAKLWIRGKWTPTGPDLRPGENREPLVSDSTGTIHISERKLLMPLKECDPTVPSYIQDPSGQLAAAVNLSMADWDRAITLTLEPQCLVRMTATCPANPPEGRRITWTKAFVRIPGSSISYLLRQTGDASGQFHYLLPPGRYEMVAFAGSDDPTDACSTNYMETDTTVVPLEVTPGQSEADLGTIKLRLARNPKPYGNNPRLASSAP